MAIATSKELKQYAGTNYFSTITKAAYQSLRNFQMPEHSNPVVRHQMHLYVPFYSSLVNLKKNHALSAIEGFRGLSLFYSFTTPVKSADPTSIEFGAGAESQILLYFTSVALYGCAYLPWAYTQFRRERNAKSKQR